MWLLCDYSLQTQFCPPCGCLVLFMVVGVEPVLTFTLLKYQLYIWAHCQMALSFDFFCWCLSNVINCTSIPSHRSQWAKCQGLTAFDFCQKIVRVCSFSVLSPNQYELGWPLTCSA